MFLETAGNERDGRGKGGENKIEVSVLFIVDDV